MIRVAWVRGAYLNNFEGQNYNLKETGIHITGISSKYPIDASIPFPLIRLSSPADIPLMPLLRYIPPIRLLTKYICNRLMGDSQLLIGLEKLAPSFDIFHTADPHYYYSYQLAVLRAKNLIKRLIVTSWETIPFNNESIPHKKKLKQYVLDHADQFVCYTQKAAETLNREGISMRKITVIKLGIDQTIFFPPDNRSTEVKTILFVGRLVEEKGILDLYQAFAGIRTPTVKLRIVGNGPLKKSLLRSIAADGLENRVSIEQHSYREMPAVFRETDMFVLPSRTTPTWEEQYGMVLAEAMASGLPIITTSTGAIHEVTGDAALTVEAGDVRGLGRAMRHLITDKKKYVQKSEEALRRAQEYLDSHKTAKIIGTIYSEIYEKISHHGSNPYS